MYFFQEQTFHIQVQSIEFTRIKLEPFATVHFLERPWKKILEML